MCIYVFCAVEMNESHVHTVAERTASNASASPVLCCTAGGACPRLSFAGRYLKDPVEDCLSLTMRLAGL
jgi:hypothetical protein